MIHLVEIALNKISEIHLYNTPIPNKETEIKLNKDKQFLILTGYNGSGKSRVLGVIQETFSAPRKKTYNGRLKDWICDIYLNEGEVRLRALKLDVKSSPDESTKKKILAKINSKHGNLKEIFESSKSKIQPDENISSNSDDENNRSGSLNFGAFQVEEKLKDQYDKRLPSSIQSILYMEEKIYFNHNKEVMDAVFKGEPGIDQTLYMLIHEFLAEHALNNSAESILKEFFDQNKEKLKDSSEIEIEKLLRASFDVKKLLSAINPLEKTDAFIELNKFFSMTKRKLIWRDGSILLELQDQTAVSWVDFSKGEKTLVSLILAISTYKDNTVFILDEPDLSLHMEWQKLLLPAFQRLAPNSQFIISTHSPFMVMNTDSEQVMNLAKLYSESES
ncbi:AAA family ATPase [Pseudomonas nitroreducens]|uniref:AAA family ATPase n=1 Tax=Pseudomonas nitroreducens TaxID=46680 RepID=UPI001FB68A7A|nr:AAA family ATPase [Pseudomonas nitroreducens]MCJ1881977.1 ATP-binding protein [Pseudomonas nitroreducens]MCJ1895472.1 ATP-binding protein [Pseudomonas nitroreducens]